MLPWLARIVAIIAVVALTMIGLEALDVGLFSAVLSQRPENSDLVALLERRSYWALAGAFVAMLGAIVIAYLILRRVTTPWRSAGVVAVLGIAVAAGTAWSWRDVQRSWQAYEDGGRSLKHIKNWYYHLGKIDVDRIAKSDAEMLVIDFARNDGQISLTRAEVARVAQRPDGGGRRPVIAYLSIGEAEGYRFYWKPEWESKKPAWHIAENCAWPRNHLVRFWHAAWKDIMFSGPDAYLKRIIDAGFDGVYLDRVDVYGELVKERSTARADMIEFVSQLAQTARAIKPGFHIIAQNADGLLADRDYRALIDGLGKEDLLFGQNSTGGRNSFRRIWRSSRNIRKLQWDFKPIFAVEYLETKKAMIEAAREMRSLNLVPTFAHRDLDGFDPLMERPPSVELYGTPEWIAKECTAKGKRHW